MQKRFFAALFCMAAYAAMAQPRLPQNHFWQKLDNGLEVVVIENHKVPLATIEIAVKNGAYTEGPEYSGLSHLFEHMFFKANRDYPTQEKFLKRTQELGAIWNGTTGEERVNYYFTFDRDSLEAGLNFMNAAVRYPIYREEDMQKERPVVDGEFQRAESNPSFLLYHEIGQKLWGDLFTRKNPIGDHNIINTATPEKMMIIKDKYYVPNNSMLVICGDVKPDQAFALAKKIYGDWKPAAEDPQVKYPIPDFKPIAKTEYLIKESSIAQNPQMMFMWQGPDFRNDSVATIAADVFSKILSLNSSKWQQALIDKGLASGADFSYQTSRYVGPAGIYVMPIPSKMKECYQEVMNQVSHLGDADYFTDAELAKAKEGLKRQQIRQSEKPSRLASQLTFYWTSTSLDYYTDYYKAMDKITKADIQAYLNKYIVGKPYIAGLIINSAMNSQYKPAEYFKTQNL
ncbi:MAG TPA: pitrilysin family protein [Chitinophagaceae bacterium]|nr:pitrilysin family protein [Chitinophagaceae bacterium]